MSDVYQMSTRSGDLSLPIPVKAGAVIEAGSLFGVDATGHAVAANAAGVARIAGRAHQLFDNTAGADGDLTVSAERLTYTVANSGNLPVTAAHIFNPVYLESQNVVRAVQTAAAEPVAGILLGFEDGLPVVTVASVPGARFAGFHDVDGATLTAAQSGGLFTNLGAAGAATFVLPAAVPGLEFRFAVKVAQELRVDPNGTETIELPSTAAQAAAGKYIGADAIGENLHVRCLVVGTWSVVTAAGTWTAQA